MLVEREALLAELLGFAAEGFAGQGRLVFLGGEAGVGKTSLVRALVSALDGRCRVLVGAVDNLTTADALAAFRDALAELGPELDGDRLALFRSIRQQLASGPTLLVLEDLHWADEATLDALRFLGRRLDGLPVLVVATYRHDQVNARHPLTVVLGELAGLPQVRRVLVPALTPEGVARLVRDAGAEQDPESLHHRTQGNAFFVTEVLATGADDLPATVRDAVLARAAGLSAGAAAVVAAAAVLGTTASLDLLSAVSDRPVTDIDEAVDRGVLVTVEAGVAFRHDLAREAIEASLTASRRRELHQRALRRLSEDTPTDHRSLAHHALGAGEDALAVRHAVAAAERAARLSAHREAVAQYQLAVRAVRTGETSRAGRAALFEALSYECYLTNQLPEAVTARNQALDLYELDGDLVRVGDSLRWLSRLNWFLGRNDEAERYGLRSVETLGPLGDSHELAMAFSNLAQLRMLAGDAPGTLDWGGRALAMARRLGDLEVEIHALNNMGSARGRGDGTLEGETMLKRSLDLALAADAHEHAARAFTNLGSTATTDHRTRDALAALDAGIAYCEDRDLDSWTRYMQATKVVALADLGSWDEAGALCAQLLTHPDLTPITVIPAAAAAARIGARRGLDASALLARAVALAPSTGELQRIAPTACAEAEVAWLEDRTETIAGATDVALDLVATHPDPWVLGELLWWRTLAGRPPAAAAAEGDVAEPFALLLAGRFDEAAAAWQARESPLWTAYSLGLAADGDSASRALAVLDGLGAAAASAAILRTRRQRGLPLPRRPRAATRANDAGLTAREQDILTLLADGLSTAEIAQRLVLSPRTVEHHVSSVLHKLGEPSRGRAVAAARRLALLDPA